MADYEDSIRKTQEWIRDCDDEIKACLVGLEVLCEWEQNPVIQQNDDGTFSLVLNTPSGFSSSSSISCSEKSGHWFGTGDVCGLASFTHWKLRGDGKTPMLAAIDLVDNIKSVFAWAAGSSLGSRNRAEHDLGAIILESAMTELKEACDEISED